MLLPILLFLWIPFLLDISIFAQWLSAWVNFLSSKLFNFIIREESNVEGHPVYLEKKNIFHYFYQHPCCGLYSLPFQHKNSPILRADSGGSNVHINKVLMNLVSNAAEAVEGSGNVAISTMNRYLDRPMKGYDDVNIGEYVVLSVSDDGLGIP